MHCTRDEHCWSVVCPLLSLLFMAAPDALPGDPVAVPAEQTSRSLWRVSRSGKSAFLLGSVHVLTSGGCGTDAVVEAAYAAAQAVVFETDLGALDSPALRERMDSLGRLPGDTILADVVSAATFDRLRKVFEERGRDVAAVERLKPAFCTLRIIMLEFERLGLSSMYGVDRHFLRRARLDGKRVLGLETPEAHVQLFAGLNAEDGEELLEQALESLGDMSALIAELSAAWRSGQSKKLAELIEASFEGHPRLYELFVANRNREWVPRLEELVEDGTTALVIVGVGHLVGSGSLVELMRARGFEVKQL